MAALTCVISRAAVFVTSVVRLINVEVTSFEMLWFSIQNVMMKVASIIKADCFGW